MQQNRFFDGMRAAVPFAEALVRIGARKPTTGSYAAPVGRNVTGVDPALAEAVGPKAAVPRP